MKRQIEKARFRKRVISLTSLIDVIFLLLLFFMLSSSFTRYSEIEILAGGGPSAQSLDHPPIFVKIDAEQLSVNGVVQDLETLVPALKKQISPDQTVLLSVSKEVDAQRFVDVLAPLKTEFLNPIIVIGG